MNIMNKIYICALSIFQLDKKQCWCFANSLENYTIRSLRESWFLSINYLNIKEINDTRCMVEIGEYTRWMLFVSSIKTMFHSGHVLTFK